MKTMTRMIVTKMRTRMAKTIKMEKMVRNLTVIQIKIAKVEDAE